MPNLIPDWLPWMRPAGRLMWSLLLMAIGLAVLLALLRRPKPDRPATWAECMAGAVGVFALMTLAYGIIPHEWITFSDGYLRWDTTRFVVRSGQEILFVEFPFDVNQQAVRDIVASGIYIVFLGLQVFLIVKWQDRGKVVETTAEEAPRLSRFGRPLRRRRTAEVGTSEGAAPEPVVTS